MKSWLPFVLDTTSAIITAFILLTQVILPLWFGFPIFWILRKSGRSEVDRRFRSYFGKPQKAKPTQERKVKKENGQNPAV